MDFGGWLRSLGLECCEAFLPLVCSPWQSVRGFFRRNWVRIFDPVMQEECRHVLFFYNWMAWHRARLSCWRRMIFDWRPARVFVGLIYERSMILFRIGRNTMRADRNNLTDIDVTPDIVLGACIAENNRRMAAYDARLLRPTFVPMPARFARFFV